MIKLSRISRLGMLCAVAGMLSCMPHAYAQSQSFFWEPEDPPYEGYPQIGMGVAISGHAAAIGAPYYDFFADPDALYPAWEGLVNVYVADAGRTHWNLLTVLHAADDSPGNGAFGKAIAMDGRWLVVASNAALHVYERRHGNYELRDTVVLGDATVAESAPVQFAHDVLVISVLNNTGGSGLRLFRIDLRGKARSMAALSPAPDPNLYDVAAVSLDADARALALGLRSLSGARGRVYLYERHGGAWRRSAIVTAPSSSAAGFGSSLALRGKRLVVGAPSEDQEVQDNSFLWGGAVYVYHRANDGWLRVQRLAASDPAQPSYGLVGFGSQIVASGRHVWITAPTAHDQFASDVQMGPASLYRWNAGHLEYLVDGPDSMPGGAIDMSRRYVIEGDIFGGIHNLEGAHIVDLGTLVPGDTVEAEAAGDDGEE
jgi:hypothetical protein